MGLFDGIKKKTTIISGFTVKGADWDSYSYTYGGNNAAVIEFDMPFAIDYRNVGAYSSCRRVVVYINPDNCTADGLPTQQEHTNLLKVERTLLLFLRNVDCKLVAIMSYGAMRDFVFQVKDIATFASAIPKAIDEIPYKVDLIATEDFSFYQNKVRPNEGVLQSVQNRRVIKTLLDAGTNPEKIHAIDNWFRGLDEPLQGLTKQLTNKGYKIVPFDEGHLKVTVEMPLDMNEISAMTKRFLALAESCQCWYDGWSAAVVK